MNSVKHLILSLLLTFFICIAGTAGYMTIEDWNLLDSIYMTVTTIATVGYGEVHEVSRNGRIFTIILMKAGCYTQLMFQSRFLLIYSRRHGSIHGRRKN